MIGLTYVLQGFAVLFMIGAAVLMYFTIQQGRYPMAAVQFFLFAVNAVFFYWQGVIRATIH